MISADFLIVVGILLIAFIVGRTKNRKLPPGPIGLPLLGYYPFLTNVPHLQFIKLAEKYGKIFSFYLGSELVVVLNDGDEIRDVLSRKEVQGRPLRNRQSVFGIETPFASPNLKFWQEQRRFVVQTMKDLGLGKSKIERHIHNEIQYFMKILGQSDGKPVDILKPLLSSVSNNMCSLISGERYDYDNPERIILDQALHKFSGTPTQKLAIIYFPWLKYFPFLLRLLPHDEVRSAVSDIFNLVRRKVEQHKKTLDPHNIRDFIDSYLLEMQIRKTTDPQTTFSETNLLGASHTLFIAGSDSIRMTISWCIYIMAAYPEIQKKVQKEIDDVIGSEKTAQYVDHKNMPYCQAVIREVTRWKATVALNPFRYTVDDIEVSGFLIPKGTIVIANFWAVHHDPKYWTDPEKFLPNRFLNQDGTILKTNYFIPFSVGKKSCPAETMSMMEVFLYFVSILQKFRVSFPEGYCPTFEAKLGTIVRLKNCEVCFTPK